ncbi:hypothetical protein R1sor_003838 [Riccia sorocarpa]|uniref:Uncharacterized protein n=1 Tax=Riccia sorocarpa TaxID=122646 RepID=A0ABD3H4Y7_9MARC
MWMSEIPSATLIWNVLDISPTISMHTTASIALVYGMCIRSLNSAIVFVVMNVGLGDGDQGEISVIFVDAFIFSNTHISPFSKPLSLRLAMPYSDILRQVVADEVVAIRRQDKTFEGLAFVASSEVFY